MTKRSHAVAGTDARANLRAKLEALSDERLRAILSPVQRHVWEAEAVGLAAEILRARGRPAELRDDCPACGGELDHGTIHVHGTLMGLLVVGLSWQHVWFHANDRGKDELVLHRTTTAPACRCRTCGTVMFAADPPILQ